MGLDDKKYAATNETTKIKYKNKTYKLKTCCKQCGLTMKKLLKTNKKVFDKKYVSKLEKNGLLLLKKSIY